MLKKTLFRTSLLAAILVSLAACSSNEDDDKPNDMNETSGEMNGTETEPVVTEPVTEPVETETVTDPVVTNPVNVNLNNRTPQIITSACDTLPVADLEQSNASDAPTVITVGQLVSGRLENKDSITNTEHFWNVALEAGYYHIVFDSARLDGRDSNIGLIVTDLKAAGAEDDVDIILSSDVDYQSRWHVFFEVTEPRTVALRVATRFAAEKYSFAVLENGSAVPSPSFTDCPTIQVLSLDTTVAFDAVDSVTTENDLWFEADLRSGDYTLAVTAAREDGTTGNVIYATEYTDQFGQRSRYKVIDRFVETNVITTASERPISRSQSGPIWIRLQGGVNPLKMELSLRAGN